MGGQLTNSQGIALDVAGDRMYVAGWTLNKLVCADLVHTSLYVAGYYSNNVYRLSPGGEAELTGLTGQLSGPHSLAVDPYNGYLFVADSSSVVRSDLDGNGATKLNALSSSCPAPRGIAVDASGLIYVGCAGANKVIRAGLDGSNIVNLGSLNGTVVSPNAVAIDPRGFLLLPLLVR